MAILIEFEITRLNAALPLADADILFADGSAILKVLSGTNNLQLSDGTNTTVFADALTQSVTSTIRVFTTTNTMQLSVDDVDLAAVDFDGFSGQLEILTDSDDFTVRNLSITTSGDPLAAQSQLGYPNLGRVAYPTAYLLDVEPDQFTLPADVAEASLGQLVEFNFPVAGTSAGAQVPYVATNCQISTDNINFFDSLNAVLGQTIYGRATAALGYQAATTYTVTSGVITDSFTVTTTAGVAVPLAESSILAYPALGRLGYPTAPLIDIQPDQFTLPDDVVNSPLGGLTEFNFVVSGTDVGEDVPFLGTNCTLSTDNVTFTTSVNAVLGQTVYGRAYAALSSLEETTHTVTSGIITDTFTITTVAIPSNYTSSGGDVSGGLGLTSKSKSYLPSGGSVEGGTGDASESKYYSPEGGEVSGGLSYTYKIKSYQGAYGDVSGGLSYTYKTKYCQGAYGEVAGGTSQTYKTKYYLGTEGDVSGGEGDYRFVPLVRLYTPQGGDVSGGGESLTFKSKSYLSSGGDVSGGDYVTTYKVRHYLPIGGDVSGGFSTLYSFIEAVPLVRIPTRVGGICRRYRSVFDVTKLVFQRYLPAYLNDNNDLVTPEGISMSVVGDLQPLDTGSSAQVEPPSGYTLTGGWKFSSKALLNTLDGLCSTRSDTVEIGGRTYYVWRSLDWQSGPLATDEYVQYFLIMKRLPNGG